MNQAVTKMKNTPIRQIGSVQELLYNQNAHTQLASVAAQHMKPERVMRLMANAIRENPKLAECEPLSFLGALMTCTGLGLEPNTPMGQAYLIPFWNNRKQVTEVQLVVGYKGLIDLARRSGNITSISANIHYSDDELWDYMEGTDPRLNHRPGPRNGEKLHAYAVAKFTDGGFAMAVLPWSHVMKTRNESNGWKQAVKYGRTDSAVWAVHEDAMARKTAIRALANYLPLSTEFRDTLSVDGRSMDYGAFALNPTDMPASNTDTIEGSAENVDEAQAPATPPKTTKPQAKPDHQTQTPKQSSPKGEQAKEDDEDASMLSQMQSDFNRADTPGDVEAVLDIWSDQTEGMEGTPFYRKVQSMADEARERIAKEAA